MNKLFENINGNIFKLKESELNNNNLNIPYYPVAILKKVNLDGQEKYFVYSDSSNNALILGYGQSGEIAINNAKKTAGYIKHGGVDNNLGDLS